MSRILEWLEPDWIDDEEDDDDDRNPLSLFFDNGLVPVLVIAATAIAALVASGAVYLTIAIWLKIGELVGPYIA